MIKKIVCIIYALIISGIGLTLWYDILAAEKLPKLQYVLLLLLGIFTTIVFAEIVLKKPKNEKDGKAV